jgi:CLIP-associating protein 1/2
MALHVLTSNIKHLTSAQLLTLLSSTSMMSSILPHFGSPQVDIRKAVVFTLVEIYLIVGDQLYPFVKNLAQSQKKLLTVYIERQLRSREAVR